MNCQPAIILKLLGLDQKINLSTGMQMKQNKYGFHVKPAGNIAWRTSLIILSSYTLFHLFLLLIVQ